MALGVRRCPQPPSSAVVMDGSKDCTPADPSDEGRDGADVRAMSCGNTTGSTRRLLRGQKTEAPPQPISLSEDNAAFSPTVRNSNIIGTDPKSTFSFVQPAKDAQDEVPSKAHPDKELKLPSIISVSGAGFSPIKIDTLTLTSRRSALVSPATVSDTSNESTQKETAVVEQRAVDSNPSDSQAVPHGLPILRKLRYPERVHAMVTEVSQTDPDLIDWVEDGTAFQVNEETSERLETVLEKYLFNKSLNSARRQFRAYGWTRRKKPVDSYKAVFYHPHFHRGRGTVEDLAAIQRNKRNGTLQARETKAKSTKSKQALQASELNVKPSGESKPTLKGSEATANVTEAKQAVEKVGIAKTRPSRKAKPLANASETKATPTVSHQSQATSNAVRKLPAKRKGENLADKERAPHDGVMTRSQPKHVVTKNVGTGTVKTQQDTQMNVLVNSHAPSRPKKAKTQGSIGTLEDVTASAPQLASGSNVPERECWNHEMGSLGIQVDTRQPNHVTENPRSRTTSCEAIQLCSCPSPVEPMSEKNVPFPAFQKPQKQLQDQQDVFSLQLFDAEADDVVTLCLIPSFEETGSDSIHLWTDEPGQKVIESFPSNFCWNYDEPIANQEAMHMSPAKRRRVTLIEPPPPPLVHNDSSSSLTPEPLSLDRGTSSSSFLEPFVGMTGVLSYVLGLDDSSEADMVEATGSACSGDEDTDGCGPHLIDGLEVDYADLLYCDDDSIYDCSFQNCPQDPF